MSLSHPETETRNHPQETVGDLLAMLDRQEEKPAGGRSLQEMFLNSLNPFEFPNLRLAALAHLRQRGIKPAEWATVTESETGQVKIIEDLTEQGKGGTKLVTWTPSGVDEGMFFDAKRNGPFLIRPSQFISVEIDHPGKHGVANGPMIVMRELYKPTTHSVSLGTTHLLPAGYQLQRGKQIVVAKSVSGFKWNDLFRKFVEMPVYTYPDQVEPKDELRVRIGRVLGPVSWVFEFKSVEPPV